MLVMLDTSHPFDEAEKELGCKVEQLPNVILHRLERVELLAKLSHKLRGEFALVNCHGHRNLYNNFLSHTHPLESPTPWRESCPRVHGGDRKHARPPRIH
jgi:hypothetical protein